MSEHAMVLAKMVDEGGACGKGVYLTRKQREALIVAISLMKSPVQASEARGGVLKDWAWKLERVLKRGHQCDVSVAADAVMQSINAELRRLSAHTQAGPGG